MIYFSWFIIGFALLRLLVSWVNWQSHLYLPKKLNLPPYPLVSVLIPARNEEKNIAVVLNDLLNLKYNPIEIIIYNDNSTDKTAEIVNEYARNNPQVHLLNGGEPEKGWLGKNFACYNLALNSSGKYLVFIDADVRVKNNLIEKAVFFAIKNNVTFFSIFPQQLMPTLGSKITVPIMNWVLLSLLPLLLVRKSKWTAFSAANGQFMFFKADVYRKIQPHKLYRNNSVEDMAIIKEYKKRNLPVATLLGNNDILCDMYDTLPEAVNGFSKNVFDFFGGSKILAFSFLIITTIGPLTVFLVNGWVWGSVYLLMTLLIRILISLTSRQSVINNLMLIVPLQIACWIIMIKAAVKSKQKTILWKDRNIFSA